MSDYGVTIKPLKIEDADGNTPDRLDNGYKYIASCNSSYNNLLAFFKNGGMDVFEQDHKDQFTRLSPPEQFMIQTGKRLFKGMEDYNDVHRFQFDLETTGLEPTLDSIFQIGIKDNRGFEVVLEIEGETEKERRDSEKLMIVKFFGIIDELKPDLISGYNSENFDWDFFFQRCDRLSMDIKKIAKTLSTSKIRRKENTVKFGADTERYEQTYMWGYNIIDIAHAVRRAQAINSDIKKWGLKYITQYADAAKENRVYVQGDKIHSTWADKENQYAFNNVNGDWYKIREDKPLEDGYELTTGAYIIQRYLKDDLWETEKVDEIFNQAAFLLAKIIPTSYMRSTTMGTAGTWKLLMCAWSYENGLGIPSTESKRDFTGGLARLLEVGYAKDVIKLDYAALYPNEQLTHDIFPDLDISGVMKGLLLYIAETRDKFKGLMNDAKERGEHKLADLYDKKQLPLKILANSFFGSFGAPYIFNWGDIDSAEEITCRGRQYLRLMVRHFHETYGFRPLVGDTDGFNFAIPDDVDNVKFTPIGTHRMTEQLKDKELSGVDAVVAEFNEKYMIGRMGLDVDDICSSTINFARKNYANNIIKKNKDGTTKTKLKVVGNTVKSAKMPTYIEEFLDKGIKLLLDGDGHGFVNYYYDYVDTIFNYRIPLAKIASKSKVKMSLDAYANRKPDKNGRAKAKQAHMELALEHNLHVNNGDVILYVNTGTKKSHGDCKTTTDKETGKKITELNCKLIPNEQLENNPDLTTDEYNVPRYLDNFNKRITPLLVCFSPEIRDEILVDVKFEKDENKQQVMTLGEKNLYTRKECELTAGHPMGEGDQDTYEDLMIMEDKEFRFWDSVDMVPNNMEEDTWVEARADYHVRMANAHRDGVANEKVKIQDLFDRMEIAELNKVADTGVLPKPILAIAEVSQMEDESMALVSSKWGDFLCLLIELFERKPEAEERAEFYKTLDKKVKKADRYDAWLLHKEERFVMTGETINVETPALSIDDVQKRAEEYRKNNEVDDVSIVVGKDTSIVPILPIEIKDEHVDNPESVEADDGETITKEGDTEEWNF